MRIYFVQILNSFQINMYVELIVVKYILMKSENKNCVYTNNSRLRYVSKYNTYIKNNLLYTKAKVIYVS